MEIIAAFFIGIFTFLIWIYPIYRIAVSDRTTGGEKVAWLILIVCVFWFAWIFYLMLAPLRQKEQTGYAHHY